MPRRDTRSPQRWPANPQTHAKIKIKGNICAAVWKAPNQSTIFGKVARLLDPISPLMELIMNWNYPSAGFNVNLYLFNTKEVPKPFAIRWTALLLGSVFQDFASPGNFRKVVAAIPRIPQQHVNISAGERKLLFYNMGDCIGCAGHWGRELPRSAKIACFPGLPHHSSGVSWFYMTFYTPNEREISWLQVDAWFKVVDVTHPSQDEFKWGRG